MWHLLKENLNYIPEKTGIYILYAFDYKGKPIKIQRFGGQDCEGILYIGRTSKQTLKKRIYNLLATIRETSKTTNHSGGLKYKTNPIIRKILFEHHLFVNIEISESPNIRELELLHEYARKFGEYPPLNK